MTLSTISSRISYASDGATLSFAFPFKIWAASDLKVYVRNNATLVDTLAVFGVDYTLSIVTYPNTGNVLFVVAPAIGQTIVIEREVPLTQDLDLIPSGNFAAENVEVEFDKIVGMLQTLRDLIARAPLLPVGSAFLNELLPNLGPASASLLLGINATGDGYVLYAPGGVSGTIPVSNYMKTVLDDPDAATARQTLGVLGGAFAVDFGSTVDNAVSAAVTVAVPGARIGDLCFACGAGGTVLTTVGIEIIAKCLASDQVQLVMVNDSGSTFDPASQSVNVLVLPHL